METIKFRQPIFDRDGTFNDWHYWGVGINQGGEIANAGWLSFKLDITNPDQSQQFTGVYDIDGKEIYMDDICSNEVAKWIVVFDRGCFSAKMVGRESSMHLALRAIVGLRVIGNIYENSEILKNT